MKRKGVVKAFLLVLAVALLCTVSIVFGCAEKHEHTFSIEWTYDADNHWHAATCEHKDEKSDLAAHTWDSGIVTGEATCLKDGEKTYTCTVCGATKKETLTGNHDLEEVAGKSATCTEDGYKTYYQCKTCHQMFSDADGKTKIDSPETIPAGHTFSDEWSYDATNHWHAATCEHKDEKADVGAHDYSDSHVCTVCGKIEVLSVAEAKNCEPGESFILRGVVLGVGHPSKIELYLLDENSGVIMGIQGDALGISGKEGSVTVPQLGSFAIGDLVEIPVRIGKTSSDGVGDKEKLVAKYDGDGSDVSDMIIEHGKSAAIDKNSADIVTISDNDDFTSFLSDEITRKSNYYKVVKISGTVYAAPNNGNKDANFMLSFNSAHNGTGASGNKNYFFVDGLSVAIKESVVNANIGIGFAKSAFGLSSYSGGRNYAFTGDIYAIYAGGATSTHQFVVVSADSIIHAAVPSTCITQGTVSYYVAADGYHSPDGTALSDIKAPLGAHKLGELVAAKQPDCQHTGNIAYYKCSVCGSYFDENKKSVDADDISIPIGDHKFVDGKCVVCGQPEGVAAMIGEDVYSTLEAAVQAVENDQTIVLAENIVLEETLKISDGKTFTIALSGYQISAAGNIETMILVESGNLRVEDGTIQGYGEVFRIDGRKNAAGLIVSDDVNIISQNGCCIYICGTASLISEGRIVSHSQTYAAITGSGLEENYGTAITIKGGEVTSENCGAIYHPQEGTLIIEDGNISGYEFAIGMHAGSLGINGGVLAATAKEFITSPNADGSTVCGAAVSVSRLVTNKDITVVISDGILRGPVALYEDDLQDGDGHGVNISISGGRFEGEICVKHCTSFISGGAYTESPSRSYIADNYIVYLTVDEEYSVISAKYLIDYTYKDGDTALANGGSAVMYEAEAGSWYRSGSGASATMKDGTISIVTENGIGSSDYMLRWVAFNPDSPAERYYGSFKLVYTITNNTDGTLQYSANVNGETTPTHATLASGESVVAEWDMTTVDNEDFINLKFKKSGAGSIVVSNIIIIPVEAE